MGKSARLILITVGVLVALVIIAAISLPLFLNADSFRTRIESTLSKSLGRKVTIQKVDLSVWSGGLVAQNASIADDPRFSNQPFVQANSVKIRVELLPLIFHKEVHVRGFALDSPKIQLLRASDGTWNYSSIGKAGATPAAHDQQTKTTFPDLTVGRVEVSNGQITVGTLSAPGAVSTPNRVYQQVNLDVKNFAFDKSFPFTASANLPADGSVSANGTAGPINPKDAAATPFSAHLEMKHIDPLAAGFVDASDGLTGLVQDLVLDASWSGQQLHVTTLTVDSPHLTVVRTNKPKQPKPPNAEGTSMLQSLAVDNAEVKNGTLTLTTAGVNGPPAVYQQLNAKVSNLTPTTASPFTLTAQLPGGGSLDAKGTAGPFNQKDTAATPVNAQISLKHVELATSGVLAPDAGISGLTDLQAQIQSNGQTANITGNAQVNGIKLAKDGQPSAKPLQTQFAVTQDERALKGAIQHATISVGQAVLNVAGNYQTSGPTTALDLKVNGNAVPINEIEAFLPALGVHLPQGSRLEGGTVTTALTVSGSTAQPIISGPVRLENTKLAGFDLGSKLHTLSELTGGRIGSATGQGTLIRSLSMDIREAGGAIRTDKVALDVAGLGTATGAGSVSAGGALDYNMLLKLTGLTGGGNANQAAPAQGGVAGLAGGLGGLIPGAAGGGKNLASIGGLTSGALKSGIPVTIGGTTSSPTFAPNLRGVISGAGANAAQGFLTQGTKGNAKTATPPQADQVKKALGGLFGKH